MRLRGVLVILVVIISLLIAKGIWLGCGVELKQGIEIEASGQVVESSQELARRVYRQMFAARMVEDKIRSLYRAGKVVGGVYLGRGQEAVSATLGALLRPREDVFAPLIRDQAGRQAFGESVKSVLQSYLGSAEGVMRGRDGNIHRGFPREGMPAMISHLGASVSVAAGMMMAKRMRGEMAGKVAGCPIGDGATSTGAFHEAMNMIGVERLPVVVLVVNNQFAYSTPNSRQFACAALVERAKGYGFAGHSVDGTSLLQSLEVISEAVNSARRGDGPQLVEAQTLRLSGHGEHDDGAYVPESLRKSACGRDCLEVGRDELMARGWLDGHELANWKLEIQAEIKNSLAEVQREPQPDPRNENWFASSYEPHRDPLWNQG